MAQTEFAATAQATAFAALMESAAIPHQLGAYRGVLTPVELDAPESESAALTGGVAGHDLGWLKRVAVRGEDRFRWLSGMVTNMVNDLPLHAGAWNLVLNAQGRIQGDLTVWREGDQLELEISADQYETLMTHLERFIIMDDVELVPLGGAAVLGLTGPNADEVLARVGLPVLPEAMFSTRVGWNGLDVHLARLYGPSTLHYALWVPEPQLAKLWKFLRTAGASPVGSNSLEALRIAEGLPVFDVELAGRDLPQETSQMRALSFSKGCYLGQEIVERIRSRGNVHRHLRALELDGPVPAAGTDLKLEDGSVAGQIRSAAKLHVAGVNRVFAMAMMRAEAEQREPLLAYTTDTADTGHAAGKARMLAAAPRFQ